MSRKRRKNLQVGDRVRVRYPGEYLEIEARIHAVRDDGQIVDLIDHPYGNELWSVPAHMVRLLISPYTPMISRHKDRPILTGQEPSISKNAPE